MADIIVRGIEIDPAALTPAQLDGIACVVCADEERSMRPVGVVDGCQVFACVPCVDGPTVLVVGNTSTADALADLTAFACDVSDRLRFPTVVALHRDYNPGDYEAVVLAEGWATSFPSAALAAEALCTDVCVLWAHEIDEYPINTVCGHCWTDDPEAAPVRTDEGWTTSICPPCADLSRRLTLPNVLVTA
ncbi:MULTISPECIES: hypothetical protein [unclassified Streptomyces]|uniref:hypothetical protein n=1 Tax=unclassified Streptomyces TaxID=2593676 RepID=UPI00093D3A92|nr:hypothetical protein [Streptomyces sp. TSRI0107]OKJ70264.1 hypothetical protein AMK31_36905 [Streptomyces sp. TSRI0107]